MRCRAAQAALARLILYHFEICTFPIRVENSLTALTGAELAFGHRCGFEEGHVMRIAARSGLKPEREQALYAAWRAKAE